MTDLIANVRLLIGDVSGTSQVFTDDEIEDMLDTRRQDVRYEKLTPVDTIAAGGAVSWVTWYGGRHWESSVALVDGSYNALTAGSANYELGKFDFTTGQTNGVLATGYMYDVYGAAADLLDRWAAKLKLGVDFSADGASFSLSQRVKLITDLAKGYRGKSISGSGMTTLTRTDVNCK
jgi:hypothetical protein